MLAQIVHLDTALEEKKKDINRQALKRQEIAGKIDETKTEYVTQRREKKKPRQSRIIIYKILPFDFMCCLTAITNSLLLKC